MAINGSEVSGSPEAPGFYNATPVDESRDLTRQGDELQDKAKSVESVG